MTTKEFNNLKENGINKDCSWIECNIDKNGNCPKGIINIRKMTIDEDNFVIDYEYPRNEINTVKIHYKQIKQIGWCK